MKNRYFLLFLCLALLLGGCRSGRTDAALRLDTLLSHAGELPAGRRYHSGAAEWEEGALPPIILANLYINQDGDSAFSLSSGWALFLATGMAGGEGAVFVADDPDTRRTISEICRERLSLLRASLGGEGATAYVLEEGDTVILFFLP